MRKLLLGLGLIFGTLAFGAVTEPDRALVERARNLLSNGGFESSTATWSATGGTVASVTAAANVGLGNAALSWDASAASQVLSNTAVTIPAGLYAANGLARCMFKTTATDYVLQAYNGSSILASATIPASTQYQQYGVNFPFPSSGSVSLRVVSASDAAVIYMDDCYVGPAANLQSVNQAQMIGSLNFAPTAGCNWTNDASGYNNMPANATCPTATVTGQASSTGKTPSITFSNLPPGEYLVAAVGRYTCATSGFAASIGFTLNDGTNNNGTVPVTCFVGSNPNFSESGVLLGKFSYTTAQSNITFNVQSRTSAGASNKAFIGASNASQENGFTMTVIRMPSTSELAYRPDQVAWRVDANIYGSNPSLGTSAVTSFSEVTDASLALAQNSGSIATQIACASGTASSGTTCTAANESIGIAFTAPAAGDVVACASFSHYLGATSLSGSATFQIVETTNTSSAVVQESNSRIANAGDSPSGVFGLDTYPMRLCGILSFSSAGQKTLRLERTQSAISGTSVSHLILADRQVNLGNRDIHWEVYPITQSIPAPLLVGSVTSNSAGLERVERVRVTAACLTTNCALAGNTSGIASVDFISAGYYQLNFASGAFSAAPSCVGNCAVADGCMVMPDYANTSSTIWRFETKNKSGVSSNATFNLTCQGPR